MPLCHCRKSKQQRAAIRSPTPSDLVPLPKQLHSSFSKGRGLGGANLVDYTGWQLVWADEFDVGSTLNPAWWNYESGFVRNQEAQWYQSQNAFLQDSKLIIEGRKVDPPLPSPMYNKTSTTWPTNQPTINYTSASVNTWGKKEFRYGRFEICAKIPTASGAWPAIWTIGHFQVNGKDAPWPSCGEVDIMEFYRAWYRDGKWILEPHLLANFAWGTDTKGNAVWNVQNVPLTHFTAQDPSWADKFHVWRMDWDANAIQIYLDDELMNSISLSQTINGTIGQGTNPFQQNVFLILNLAMGSNGGTIDDSALPMRYEIDYVRVYQRVPPA